MILYSVLVIRVTIIKL